MKSVVVASILFFEANFQICLEIAVKFKLLCTKNMKKHMQVDTVSPLFFEGRFSTFKKKKNKSNS